MGFEAVEDTPVGAIQPLATETIPPGFLICHGQPLLRADFPKLFAAIDIVHGTPNGNEFNLPDYRGRALRGRDSGAGRDPDVLSRTVNAAGGVEDDAVGSVQADLAIGHGHGGTFASSGHSHNSPVGFSGGTIYNKKAYGLGSITANVVDGINLGLFGPLGSVHHYITSGPSGSAGVGSTIGNETRMENSYVDMIIKFR